MAELVASGAVGLRRESQTRDRLQPRASQPQAPMRFFGAWSRGSKLWDHGKEFVVLDQELKGRVRLGRLWFLCSAV